MSTDEGTEVAPGTTDRDGAPGSTSGGTGVESPSWWSRDHPVFAPLIAFFTGMALVIFVFGLFGAILQQVVGYDGVGAVFPYFLTVFAVPLALVAVPRTRRFGSYMLLGMALTAIVVVAVAALTLWFLLSRDS